MKKIGTLLALLFLSGCSVTEKQAANRETQIDKLKTYLTAHRASPEEYLVRKFQDHDVILLGEMHRIRHDPLLVQKLIPVLKESGIFTLATEFARHEDQVLIDSLLSGDVYDEQLARQITFQQHMSWAYQEYVDIFKTAWTVNKSSSTDTRQFRILGLNCSPDWSFMKTSADREVDSLKRLVWGGCGERDWAEVILEKVELGEKVLVYCGMHHAFSGYLQPIVNDSGGFVRFEEDRLGRHIFEAIGRKRVMTVFLHSPWYGAGGYSDTLVRPCDGMIDDVMTLFGKTFQPMGFDVSGTPFGELAPRNTIYCAGYDNLTLADYCDGYIYQEPFDQSQAVTLIEDFINEDNLIRARQQCPNPYYRDASVEEFVTASRQTLDWWRQVLKEI